MDKKERALLAHKDWQGKIEVVSRCSVTNRDELSVAYTPGVAEPCLEISKDVDKSYTYTRRGNLVAVITDGTAVLGLGDIGPEAGMPVMEGKCALFKTFADVDAFPICIKSKDVDEIVNTIKLISGSFGGINLEDISAPRCIEIERRLKEECDIPVFHDDQHGTAVVVLASVLNALKVVGKDITRIKAVVNGAGSAGMAITRLLVSCGLKNVIMCDKFGSLYRGNEQMNDEQAKLAELTNPDNLDVNLKEALIGADLFIGVSAPNLLTEDMIKSMNNDPVVFAMANPVPEIMPDIAKAAGVRVMGTGRSDYPNQINNVLAFPGIFKGALSVRATDINEEMKLAAAKAIAGIITDDELNEEYIIPDAFDKRVVDAVSRAVAKAARETGVARL
ncbi:MAG: NADP-dependent malic enzyme [Clostridia bacterium]|nr:NADP-dependent malic enzyme [Clostridia bacterium]